MTIVIGDKKIAKDEPPFIIAEMSGNHNQSLERALQIVEKAAEAGVDALKLQTYTPDTMTLDLKKDEFFIQDSNNLWRGQYLYELYEQAHTPWEWHEPIFKRCQDLGLICFSSPFDETAIDFLEKLHAPLYKIASFENTDLPLIRRAARTGKPLIISTGMASVAELAEAVDAIKQEGCDQFVLLKCTSTYPASPAHSNLLTIPHMRELFDCQVGLSDHTLGIGAAIASVALGATVIEKHFTLSRAEGGVDAAFSLEPHEMKHLVEECRNAWDALGKVSYGPTEKEQKSMEHRRSLYISKDMKKGEFFTQQNIRSIRPGLGLPPKFLDVFIGKKINQDVQAGTPLSWDFLA